MVVGGEHIRVMMMIIMMVMMLLLLLLIVVMATTTEDAPREAGSTRESDPSSEPS